MSLPNVIINIVRDGLGGVAITNDSIMGMMLTGIEVDGKLGLDTPYAIYSVEDAKALGITLAVMPEAFKQISEFYLTAPVGAKLWIIVSDDTVTLDDKFNTALDVCPAKILRDAAGGEIRWLGACWTPGEGTPPTPEVRAYGTVQITADGANTDIARIEVDEGAATPKLLAEYKLAGGPDVQAIAAALLVDFNLKKAEGIHAYDAEILADPNDDTLKITAPAGRGVAANDYLLTFDSTGADPATATVVDFDHGVDEIPGIGYAGVTLDGLDSLVYSAALKAQTFANASAALIMPLGVIIEGIGFDGNPDHLRNVTTMTADRVQIILACTSDDMVGAVGLALGRKAAIPVQRKISRVKDGELPTLTGYLTDGNPLSDYSAALGTINDKGFIIFRTFPTKAGYYFNGDGTCAPATDDLNLAPRVRVIDKALIITYNTYVEEIEDEISVTAAGKLDPAKIAELQAKINNAVLLNMVDNISAFSSYIDPSQNILSSPTLNIVLRITPVGYLTNIIVSLGFKNPALQS